jgi:Carboxypeptidase regulatory-like domain
MRNRFFKLSLLTCALILSISTFSVAQDLDNVTISGKVTDSNNQIILGATVTAKFITTGNERTVQTDDEGRYRLINLPPGSYKLKVTAANFAPQETKELTTIAAQNVQLSFSLKPGEVSGAVEVVAGGDEALAVDTTRTIVGGTITTQQIEELPNNDRNALNLVLTLGGTSEEAGSVRDLAEDKGQNSATPAAEQGNFSLSGGTSFSNNITIDGFDNNDDRAASDRFQPSLEAVQEVQVITNQFSSEYGRASGGRINLALRSGGNKFRGRAYMFYRDDKFNANTWYNNSRGIARPPLTEYNPGFTLSGPVIIPFGEGRSIYDGHNKTFFAVNYEYNQLKDTTEVNTYVPVVGNPRYFLPAGNTSCPITSCIDGLSTAAISPYISSLSTPSLTHIFTAKIDHKFTDNNTLTFGWQLGRKNNKRTTALTTTRLDDAIQAKISNTDAFNISNTKVFGSNLINNFKAQYSIFKPSYQTDSVGEPVVLIGYRSPTVGTGTSTLIVGNSTASISGVSSAFSQSRKETRWQFQDALTYVKGSHTFKGGFDIQSVNSKATQLQEATGTFSFANMLTYSQNTLSRYLQNFGSFQDVKNTYWGAFVNDEIHFRSNLTLSYGVRYERETAVSDNNNFGPRLGIAWSPFKDGKGVIRFGSGIFYNRVLLRTVGDSIQNANANLVSFSTATIGTGATDIRRVEILKVIAQRFPTNYSTIADLRSAVLAGCANAATMGNTFACNSSTGFSTGGVSSAGNPLRSVDANLKIPESYQFNVGFERDIGKGFVFEANFTWNKTAHLWRDFNSNAPRLPSQYKDWTAYLTANPYTFTNANGTVRTYNFYLGTNPNVSVSTAQEGTTACSTTTTTPCYVNLNTTSSSSTAPSTAVGGLSGNSVGGAIGLALAAIARFRPDQTVEETSRIFSGGNSFYKGLILELRSRRKKLGYGFSSTFRGVYTLSTTKDDGLNNTSNAEVNGDFSREFARNVQDRRHRFAFTGTFDTPSWFGKLRFSPLFRFGSSNPFNLGDGGSDRNLDDVGTDRLNFSGNIKDIIFRKPNSTAIVSNTLFDQFSLAPIGAKGGNLPRNAGTGPSFYVFDLSITREFKLTDRTKFRPTVQIGNILNAAVFSYGSAFIDYSPGGQPLFLIPTRAYRPRDMRLGFRFDF